MQKTERPTVARIEFSRRQVFPYAGRGVPEEYIAAFGPRPIPDRLDLPAGCYFDEPVLRAQIRQASVSLMLEGIDHDKGPYADRNHALERLSGEVFRDSGGRALDDIECVADRLRPADSSPAERMLPRRFGFGKTGLSFNPHLLVPPEFPTAGVMLGQEERHSGDSFTLVHKLEPYILACALLRMRGMLAYPSRGFTGEEGEGAHVPLISIFQSDSSLATFRMLRVHPDLERIEIWSDSAVMGALHAMKAVVMANDLAARDVASFIDGRAIPPEDYWKAMTGIAGELRAAASKMTLAGEQYYYLIPESVGEISSHIYQAEAWKGSVVAFGSLPPSREIGADLFLKSRGITYPAPLLPIGPAHAAMALECDERLAGHYPQLAGRILGAWKAAARKGELAYDTMMSLLLEGSQIGE